MKRIIAGLMVAVLCLLLIIGCSKKEEKQSTKSTTQTKEETTKSEAGSEKKALIKFDTSGEGWDEIFAYWDEIDEDGFVNVGTVPEGLPADNSLCIVILGYQLKSDGTMYDELITRLQCGLKFANEYPNAYVLVTGGPTAADNKETTEADEMAGWLIKNGIREDRLIIENRSLTSATNALFSAKLIREHPEIDQVAIVTSDYHVPLGCLLFNTQFILDQANGAAPIRVVSNSACKTQGKSSFDLNSQAGWMNTLLSERNKDAKGLYETTETVDETAATAETTIVAEPKKMPRDVSNDDRRLIVEMIYETEWAEIDEELLWQLDGEDLIEAVQDMFGFWDDAIYQEYPEADVVPEGLPNDGSMIILIMGLELNGDGTMKDELIQRLKLGLQAAKKYPNAPILVTGGGTAEDDPDITEAKVMREWLIKQGISKNRIFYEDRAYNSSENAVYSLSLLKEDCPKVDGIMIVTSDYHAPWAEMVFKSLFNFEKKLGGEDYKIYGGAYYGAPFATEEFPPSVQQWLLESLVWNR